jgi:DNA-binding GntR family transcriptional regulator
MAHAALIAHSTGTATVHEWAKLDLDTPSSRVLRMTRVQHDDNHQAIALEEVVLPLDRFPGLIADASDLTQLAQCYGLSLSRATERVTIVRATKDVALHLGIAAGADVMKLDRLIETTDGEPVEWRVTLRRV